MNTAVNTVVVKHKFKHKHGVFKSKSAIFKTPQTRKKQDRRLVVVVGDLRTKIRSAALRDRHHRLLVRNGSHFIVACFQTWNNQALRLIVKAKVFASD